MKKYFNKKFFGFVIINFLVAGLLSLALVWAVFAGIKSYTEYGVSEIVPDLREAYLEEAEIILKQQGLYAKVIDSVYYRNKRLGTIVEQIPAPGSGIKHNRPVYLIVNSQQIKKIPLPQINDYSLRQAKAVLQAIGLNVGKVQYVPSEYKGLVLDVMYLGESVLPGFQVPEGDSILLVVGAGLDVRKERIPNVIGLTEEDARKSISVASFVLGAVHYEYQIASESDRYFVYKQEPAAGEFFFVGSSVNLWLTNDSEFLKRSEEQEPQEEEFF